MSEENKKFKEISIEERITELLKQQNLMVTTAESYTGGLIVGRLVNVPGISSHLSESYITYSNEAKERLLGVRYETLKTYGAVSRQTAEEMAEGVRKAAKAHVSVVSTGIAGPDGGTAEKPVGLVYLGCSCLGRIKVEEHLYKGNRMQIRQASVEAALQLLEKMISEESKRGFS